MHAARYAGGYTRSVTRQTGMVGNGAGYIRWNRGTGRSVRRGSTTSAIMVMTEDYDCTIIYKEGYRGRSRGAVRRRACWFCDGTMHTRRSHLPCSYPRLSPYPRLTRRVNLPRAACRTTPKLWGEKNAYIHTNSSRRTHSLRCPLSLFHPQRKKNTARVLSRCLTNRHAATVASLVYSY